MVRKSLRVVGLSLIFLFLCLGTCGIATLIQCEMVKAKPEVLIYPNAVLIQENTVGLGGSRPYVAEHYTSVDAPEKIVEFFEQHSTCVFNARRNYCRGSATPYGTFDVYLETGVSGNGSRYLLEINWDACAWFE
ncbi:MAG: hypothetical protein KF716_15605 [Anaerolineae bacterium]|nr:hypothetical protein [Anaerolineae bacterium]